MLLQNVVWTNTNLGKGYELSIYRRRVKPTIFTCVDSRMDLSADTSVIRCFLVFGGLILSNIDMFEHKTSFYSCIFYVDNMRANHTPLQTFYLHFFLA